MGDAAKIICPNQLCQAPNPENHRFCQQCRTPVPKRYLWAVGAEIEAYKPGKLLAERYFYKRDRILLDTKPGFIPTFPTEISDEILPYLRLFAHRLHIPQVYGQLILKKGKGEPICLLEQAPIWTNKKDRAPTLMPELAVAWKDAPAIRQLNWLWQIAQLWQPFSRIGVTSSLLEPKLLRVEGSIVRLLELKLDRGELPLSYLGEAWRYLVKDAKSNIAEFFATLCEQLIRGQIFPEELLAQLERAILTVGTEQTRTYEIATLTDTGPIRQRNEDACYPPSGSFYRISAGSQALAVVCDGIGGHEGGNVASNLAIETIIAQASRWQSQNLSAGGGNASLDLNLELEDTVCEANDRISKRNDTEGRSDRQRMGTTLVMALAQAHQMYVTHIGDSRVYWITRTGCHQITLDDDVASREVRLGYAVYREALQQVGSGSLVQALGMSSSNNLHPTLQRFVLDEDCIFLLCSDGLSDYDRVEQNWEKEFLPVLEGKLNLASAAAKAIEIANTQNGHDNVTVALVYCQVSRSEDSRKSSTPVSVTGLRSSNPNEITELPPTSGIMEDESPSMLKTQLAVRRERKSLLPLLLGILVLLGLAGVIAYFVFGQWADLPVSSSNPTLEIKPHTPSLDTSTPGSNSVSSLTIGSVIQVKNSLSKNSQGESTPFVLYETPQKQKAIGVILESSILEIVKKQALKGQETWLQLKICSVPPKIGTGSQNKQPISQSPSLNRKPSPSPITNSPTSIPVATANQSGWVRQTDLENYIQPDANLEVGKLGKCNPPATPLKPATN